MAVVLKLKILLYVSSCEMFSFCDVLMYMKQNKKNQTNSGECAMRTGNYFLIPNSVVSLGLKMQPFSYTCGL